VTKIISRHHDFAAGLLFVLIGLISSWGAIQYRLGTPMRMGPGYYPLIVGLFLFLLGLILVTRDARFASNAPLTALNARFTFRAPIPILFSMLAFGVLLNKAGLLVASLMLIFISRLALPCLSWRETLGLGLGLGLFVVIVFIHGLKLSLPVFID
jgi:Tripartite tricarboxylate transporter TctB family